MEHLEQLAWPVGQSVRRRQRVVAETVLDPPVSLDVGGGVPALWRPVPAGGAPRPRGDGPADPSSSWPARRGTAGTTRTRAARAAGGGHRRVRSRRPMIVGVGADTWAKVSLCVLTGLVRQASVLRRAASLTRTSARAIICTVGRSSSHPRRATGEEAGSHNGDSVNQQAFHPAYCHLIDLRHLPHNLISDRTAVCSSVAWLPGTFCLTNPFLGRDK